LKPLVCWFSCFPEFETKLEVCLLHNDEEKHSIHGVTTDDDWVITFFSLIHKGSETELTEIGYSWFMRQTIVAS
jgi:hypothetical protein